MRKDDSGTAERSKMRKSGYVCRNNEHRQSYEPNENSALNQKSLPLYLSVLERCNSNLDKRQRRMETVAKAGLDKDDQFWII